MEREFAFHKFRKRKQKHHAHVTRDFNKAVVENRGARNADFFGKHRSARLLQVHADPFSRALQCRLRQGFGAVASVHVEPTTHKPFGNGILDAHAANALRWKRRLALTASSAKHRVHKPRSTLAEICRLCKFHAIVNRSVIRHVHKEHLEEAHFKNHAGFERWQFLCERLDEIFKVQVPAANAQSKFHRKRRKSAFLDERAVFLPKQKDSKGFFTFR